MNMTIDQIASILQQSYEQEAWRNVYIYLFPTASLFQKPTRIEENSSLIKQMVQLGYVQFGAEKLLLFDIEVNPDVSLKRNRVALNNILAKWLTAGTDDAAIAVFHVSNHSSYRFTFARKSVYFDDNGVLVTDRTNAKRYTYVLGPEKHCRTAIQRFEKLHNTQNITLASVEEAFSIEALTKEFYGKLFDWFTWATQPDSGITFPNNARLPEEAQEELSVKIIRLITRLLFVWFIKQKGLVPERIFDATQIGSVLKNFHKDSSEEGTYYNAILQNLFFATLNRAIIDEDGLPRRFANSRDRRDLRNLYRYSEMFSISEAEVVQLFSKIPFLNGELFECQDKFVKTDIQQENDRYFDGFSRNSRIENGRYKYRAFIPNKFFFSEDEHQLGLLTILKQYNFTIEENTTNDAQVSLDPELLGRVFENLLASYNTETRETVRNSTGSFYTPREIVDYMVEESLIAYLTCKCGDKYHGDIQKFMISHKTEHLPDSLREAIVVHLQAIKILDPACGSGAFPMGCLLRIVDTIERLKPGLNRYEQKLALIENCIYGVDIQPIAMLISKLRFFISLICDQENIDFDDAAHNYCVNTLPNMETKFIAANTLIPADIRPYKLDWASQEEFGHLVTLKNELLQIRHEHFYAKSQYRKEKNRQLDEQKCKEIQQYIVDTQAKIDVHKVQAAEEQIAKLTEELKLYPEKWIDETERQQTLFGDDTPTLFHRDVNKPQRDKILEFIKRNQEVITKERAKTVPAGFAAAVNQVTHWNPYDQNTSSPFFDAEWMFGVNDGFDVVIGNPPYIQLQDNGGKLGNLYANKDFRTFEKTGDIYCLFYEKGWQLLKDEAHLCFITSNKWMRAGYGKSLRNFLATETNPELLVDFAGQKIFESATVDTNIILYTKRAENRGNTRACIAKAGCREDLSGFVRQNQTLCSFTSNESWVILNPIEQSIKRKIEAVGVPLKDWDIQINYGIKTGCNEAFIIDEEKKAELIAEDPKSAEIIRPILRGRDIKRYGYTWANLYLIATFPSRHYDIEEYPAVKDYLLTFDKKRLIEAGLTEIAESDSLLHEFCYQRLSQNGKDIVINGQKVFIDGKAEKSRKKTGNKWFETQDQIGYWEDFSKQKIVWGEISDKTKFCLDFYGRFVPEATTFLMTGYHLEYLLCFLNSMLSEYLFSKIGTTTGVGTVRWKKFKLENLVVPQWNIKREEKLLPFLKKMQLNPEKEMEFLLDEQIFEICGLSDYEVKFIKENLKR